MSSRHLGLAKQIEPPYAAAVRFSLRSTPDWLSPQLVPKILKITRISDEKRICRGCRLICFAGLAAAQAPVAVVEDVQGQVTGAEFMDYVAPGKVIKLGPAGTVVLGYMKSCRRETITGVGTVIVGAEESMVHLGEVKASKVRLRFQPFAADQSRNRRKCRDGGPQHATRTRRDARFTLYGLSPRHRDHRAAASCWLSGSM